MPDKLFQWLVRVCKAEMYPQFNGNLIIQPQSKSKRAEEQKWKDTICIDLNAKRWTKTKTWASLKRIVHIANKPVTDDERVRFRKWQVEHSLSMMSFYHSLSLSHSLIENLSAENAAAPRSKASIEMCKNDSHEMIPLIRKIFNNHKTHVTTKNEQPRKPVIPPPRPSKANIPQREMERKMKKMHTHTQIQLYRPSWVKMK